MCHGAPIAAFPVPHDGKPVDGAVRAYSYGPKAANRAIAIIPDIFGYRGFYQGLAAYYAEKGARVYLTDPFHGFGELAEGTREEAFTRRAKVRDAAFLDALEAFANEQGVTGVLGFCLGGLYVFELARRGMDAALVGLYGFPQGLPNQDPLPVPFDYLPQLDRRHIMLMGRDDSSVGAANIVRLESIAAGNPAIDLTVYDGVGHNFLPLLDSSDPAELAVARDALARCDAALIGY